MKAKAQDIAAMFGVSVATVSNALNGKKGVSKAVRDKIIAAAIEMGYSLHKPLPETKRHIRLIMFKIHGSVIVDSQFFSELSESIQMECQAANLELIINHVYKGSDTEWRTQISEFCDEKSAGIILLATEMNEEMLRCFDNCKSPLIALDNLFRDSPVSSVVMNNYEAGRIATQELFRNGHSHIGHITSNVPFSNAYDRCKGYEAVMREHKTENQLDIWYIRPTIEGAYEDIRKLIESGRKLPTAFFAGNDMMAIGAIRAMQEAGISIPDDVSLIGMDDTDLCLACSPQLSTIRVFRREMGRAVVRQLLFVVPVTGRCNLKTEMAVELICRSSVRRIPAAK